MTIASLAPLADRAALFVALRQDALANALTSLGEYRWDVDMTAGTLTFSNPADASQQMVTRAHFIASLAPGPRSLLWGWAHPQGGPDGVAAQLRDYGTQYGIAELSEGEVPFPEDTGDDIGDWIAQTATQLGAVATEITGLSPFYTTPMGGGTRAVFVLETPLAPVTVAEAVAAMPRLLSSLALPDARSSVWDLARLAGWSMQWTDDQFSGATVSDASGSATITFDEYARITGINGALGGGGN